MTADFGATKAGVNPRNYVVPDFGQDRDITDSLSNLRAQEGIHGEWELPVEPVKTWTYQTPGPYVSSAGPPNAPLVAGVNPITLNDAFNAPVGN